VVDHFLAIHKTLSNPCRRKKKEKRKKFAFKCRKIKEKFAKKN
jgi:hypothetical protein